MQRLSEITERMLADRAPQIGRRASFAVSAALVGHNDPLGKLLEGWALRSMDVCAAEAANFITKAPHAAANLGDLEADPTNLDFIRLEAQTSIFSEIALARPYPIQTRLLTPDEPITAVLLAEGAPIPLSGRWAQTNMGLRKVGAMTVITKEFAKVLKSTPSLSLAGELAQACGVAKDAEFIDAIGTASTITETSGGSSLAQIDTNLSSMLTKSRTARFRRDQMRWTMGEQTYDYLTGLRGSGGAPAYPELSDAEAPSLRGVPVSVGAGAGGYILLLDDSRIIAWPGVTDLATSESGSIEMDTSPSNDSVVPTDAELVSMFQSNSMALRAVSFFSFIENPVACVSMTVSY